MLLLRAKPEKSAKEIMQILQILHEQSKKVPPPAPQFRIVWLFD